MKRMLAILLLIPMLLALVACEEEEAEPENLAGGWHISTESAAITLDEFGQTAWDKAVADQKDDTLEPIALLGTQVVAGTNYYLLCRSTSKGENAAALYVARLYAGVDGTAELKLADFDVAAYRDAAEAENADGAQSEELDAVDGGGLLGVAAPTDGAVVTVEPPTDGAPIDGAPIDGAPIDGAPIDGEAVVGGVTVANDSPEATLPEGAAKAMEGAFADLTGYYHKPLALLATQVVAGTNYAILCTGSAVVPNAAAKLEVVYIYAALDGTYEVLNIGTVSLSDFAF